MTAPVAAEAPGMTAPDLDLLALDAWRAHSRWRWHVDHCPACLVGDACPVANRRADEADTAGKRVRVAKGGHTTDTTAPLLAAPQT